MATHLRTNATLSHMRNTTEVADGLPALVLPETRAEVIALRTEETPAGQLFHILFNTLIDDLRQGDRLVDEATSASYRITSWQHFATPRGAHTEVNAESRLGNA